MKNEMLSAEQKRLFHENGYLKDLEPIYDDAGVAAPNEGMKGLRKFLKQNETSLEIREWHEASTFLFDICMYPKILDYVDDLIGPNFLCGAAVFSTKNRIRAKQYLGIKTRTTGL